MLSSIAGAELVVAAEAAGQVSDRGGGVVAEEGQQAQGIWVGGEVGIVRLVVAVRPGEVQLRAAVFGEQCRGGGD